MASMDTKVGTTHVADKIQDLSDLELAVLICLIVDQHCIVEADDSLVNGVGQELRLIASDVFGLTCAVLECTPTTTVDEFGDKILVNKEDGAYDYTHRSKSIPTSSRGLPPLESRKIANVVVVKNLNRASSQVQVQALELIRGKRNFTRTAVHAAPKPFLLVIVNARDTALPMNTHLTDQLFIKHTHQPDDDLPNLAASTGKEVAGADDDSISSVVRTSPYMTEKRKSSSPIFSQQEVSQLTDLAANVEIGSEVRAYMHNIVVFMRLHRAVAGGISAMTTWYFDGLVRALAPLHGLSFVTPSLVALAARKIYPHKIVLVAPERERSMQWGSSTDAVKAVLDGVTVEDVIEEVLQSVEMPL